MLTPASPAMRLVLALSKPSRTRMRAVASISASTVARDRSCEAFFLGFVAGLRAMIRVSKCEYKNVSDRSYYSAAAGNGQNMSLSGAETPHAKESCMTSLPYAQLIDVKRWADRGLYEVV